ncbi:flagellar hook assembly protein FlgD [Pseudomonas subflava]|uniref:flagellar hook assembly protein FlgD n=1 Tax=Pseudomonas subflava TaxID=2952933 RepID=UPI00207AEF86|nr:flagellar hook assembly protein FlgD [Pseudomonas subflava]HSX70064.1 flagellar hook assembly protein FlgD [Pseudomonas sp.]
MSVENVNGSGSVLDQYQIRDQAGSNELGKDQFLQLLVAQMNNQNPLDPQTNSEFVAQLAQFSTVEGIDNLNTSFENMLASTQSSQALQASSLVGRKVIVTTNKALVDTSEPLKGSVAVTQSTDNLYVNIYDSKGNQVNRISLGAAPAGNIGFTWDGKDADGKVLPEGVYKFEAQVQVEGKTVAMDTALPANVDSVTLGQNGGEMLLNLAGLGSIPLSKVQVVGQ